MELVILNDVASGSFQLRKVV